MVVLKCKMCGGTLKIEENKTVCECEYCGTRQTVPVLEDEKKVKLFERANKLRANCEFDKAANVYESIVSDYSEEAEGYWGLILCRYGIEYVDDPLTGKKIPTCHRSSFDSVMDDEDFEMVMENSDTLSRSVYREEAKTIEEIRKGIIEVSGKEEPYDIFICYKETDENGDRTLDSVIAQDVYDELTQKGYRVFFSKISLEDKLGVEYEPYIFAALNSAKLMLVFGTSYDYFNAVWVKNEWSRYLNIMTKDKAKRLIPCFKNVDAYDIPKEFAKFQSQDMGKIGAVQDLIRGIEKLLNPEKLRAVNKYQEALIINGSSANISAYIKRGYMALEDHDWNKATEFFEQALNIDAENGQAYWGELLAEQQTENVAMLSRKICDDICLKLSNQNPIVTGTVEYEDYYSHWKEVHPSLEFLKEDDIKVLFYSYIYRLSKLKIIQDIADQNNKCFILENNRLYIRAHKFADEKLHTEIEQLKKLVQIGISDILNGIESKEKQREIELKRNLSNYFTELEHVLYDADPESKDFMINLSKWEEERQKIYEKCNQEWCRQNDEYNKKRKTLEKEIRFLEGECLKAKDGFSLFGKSDKEKKLEQLRSKRVQLSDLEIPPTLDSLVSEEMKDSKEPDKEAYSNIIKDKAFRVYEKYYMMIFESENIIKKYNDIENI